MNGPTVHETERAGARTSGRSIPDLLRELRDETVALLRQEALLARAETWEKLHKLVRNLIAVAVGAFVLFAGALLLLGALGMVAGAALLNAGVPPEHAAWLGFAIVGLLLAAIGFGLVKSRSAKLRQESLVPHETVSSLHETKDWLKEKVS